ncbi:MAG: YraN family protein [Bdellovibrionales bacterium]|nr:YraN family protein [Bdellovibrionales bacterium]
MALPSNTAPPSPELKNSFAKQRGDDCQKLAKKFLIHQGYELIKENKKIFGVEIDLIFFKKHFVFVEVKSLAHEDYQPFRLSHKQRQRLLRSQALYSSLTNQVVELWVAYVNASGEVQVIDIADLL